MIFDEIAKGNDQEVEMDKRNGQGSWTPLIAVVETEERLSRLVETYGAVGESLRGLVEALLGRQASTVH